MTLEINMDDFWQDQLKKRSSYLRKMTIQDLANLIGTDDE